MNTRIWSSVAIMAVLGAGLVSGQERKRVSPHEKVSGKIGEANITVEYGRPSLKGRKAVGGELVPFGKVWRAGADEATTLTTDRDLMIGELHVPKGTYSLFVLPSEKDWTLIVNKNPKQWGAFQYKQTDDLGRVPMTVSKAGSAVETFTIAIQPGAGGKGTLTMSWENTTASVPVMAH
jgi:hypothetical protein